VAVSDLDKGFRGGELRDQTGYCMSGRAEEVKTRYIGRVRALNAVVDRTDNCKAEHQRKGGQSGCRLEVECNSLIQYQYIEAPIPTDLVRVQNTLQMPSDVSKEGRVTINVQRSDGVNRIILTKLFSKGSGEV
jgi:hypothetical protein